MNKNAIRKMHVGWGYSWIGGTQTESPKSVREWVGKCPKCNALVRSTSSTYYGLSFTKNTRKSAKDALHYHMLRFH